MRLAILILVSQFESFRGADGNWLGQQQLLIMGGKQRLAIADHIKDANDPLPDDMPLDEGDNEQGQAMELLRQELVQARAELKEKDADIQELQTLVEALTETVNQLQGQYDEEVMIEEEGVEDPNLIGGDGQG